METISGLAVLALGGFVYFIPAIIGNKKRNSGALFLCNLLFGWTGIGWLFCLIWSFMKDPEPVQVIQTNQPTIDPQHVQDADSKN